MSCFSTGRKKRRPNRTARQNKASPGPIRVPELFVQDRRRVVGGGVLDAPWAAAIFWVLRRPQTPCRGGACPSRRKTANTDRLALKRQAPIASVAALSERHWQSQIWRHSWRTYNALKFVIARPRRGRGNLGKAVTISPMAFPRSSRILRDCHVGLWPPRNDKSEGLTPSNSCHKYCQPARRSTPVKGTPHP